MLARTTKTALACMLLSACATMPATETASTPPRTAPSADADSRDAVGAADVDTSADARLDRFRFVDQRDQGLQSVLLVPTPVKGMVAVGPLARSRVYVGALFATRRVGARRAAGVGLVIKAVGGGLGPAMSVLPRVVLTIDGEELLRGSVAGTGMYSVERGRWGPVETLMFRVPPEVIEKMAQGEEVELRLGDSVMFHLDETQIADLDAFLEQIPDGTSFDLSHEIVMAPWWRTQ